MPRVNRDLQRRMAARRERERRRPNGDRRYRFATPDTAVETDETLVEREEELEAAEAPRSTEVSARQTAVATPPAEQTSRAASKSTHRPFSAYKDEYAYVYGDLRRIAVVIGSLLAILIILYFVLPLLIH
jgi:hypothetical protein